MSGYRGIAFALLAIVMSGPLEAQEAPPEASTPPAREVPVDVARLWQVTLAAFPEAYAELTTVSFESLGDYLVPGSVEMYVPAAAFAAGLTGAKIDERLEEIIAVLLGADHATCSSHSIGELIDHPFLAWPDGLVHRLVLRFGIGC